MKELFWGFNKPVTAIMAGIIDVHHHIFFYLIIILFVVCWLLFFTVKKSTLVALPENKKYRVYRYNNGVNYKHCSFIEFLWTVTPGFVLYIMAIPSLSVLYSLDEDLQADITLKVVGNQWYWNYQYPDYLTPKNRYLIFDSNLLLDKEELYARHGVDGYFYKLLEVDNRVHLPIFLAIKALVTSVDVLHSWAIPSFGVKIDACPGRLHQVLFTILKSGIYYGQCSELCGTGHGFMPIVIKAITLQEYCDWLNGHYAGLK